MWQQNELEERRLFTYEERKTTLQRTNHICACCGKKLTTKTMTMDHVIPLSRGGTNDPKNLIALCYDCNQLKGNLLYLPFGFYSALINSPVLMELDLYVQSWFQTVKNDFDLEMFPLIAPRINMLYEPVKRHRQSKSVVFSKQFVLQWSMIGTDTVAEIEAVTDLNLREVRATINEMAHCEKHAVALYSLRKLTTDKILAVVGVLYNKETQFATIYMPWSCMVNTQMDSILYMFAVQFANSIGITANEPLVGYVLATDYEQALSRFYTHRITHNIGYSYHLTTVPQAKYAVEVVYQDYTAELHTDKETITHENKSD